MEERINDFFNLKYNPEPVCPYCGHEETNAHELGLDDGETIEHDCPACGKTYRITADVTIRYDTEPIEK